MEFHDNGTISVDIDGTTYTLRRPTLGQMWEFHDLRDELTEKAQERIHALAQELAENEDDEGLQAELKDRRFAFRFLSEPWLRRAFEELGNQPLPDSLDNAPSELADPRLPSEILLFWRDVPLVRSRRGERPR